MKYLTLLITPLLLFGVEYTNQFNVPNDKNMQLEVIQAPTEIELTLPPTPPNDTLFKPLHNPVAIDTCSSPVHGQVSINNDGRTLEYIPDNTSIGIDTFICNMDDASNTKLDVMVYLSSGSVTLQPIDQTSQNTCLVSISTASSINDHTIHSSVSVTPNTENLIPPSSMAEHNIYQPINILSATTDGVGYTLTLTFRLNNESKNKFIGYLKWGYENEADFNQDKKTWYDYQTKIQNANLTGYEISEEGKVLTVTLVDGLRGDDDFSANGAIIDPGLPLIIGEDTPSLNAIYYLLMQ